MTSLQAHLLIASPELPEPFAQAVVLLVRHNAEGALGLILNKCTAASLEEHWGQVSDVACHRQQAIFLGGPCEGPLVALHTDEFLLEIEVLPGLYFTAGKEKLESLAAQTDERPAKFFAGYSGWSAGQLENEIAPRLLVGDAGRGSARVRLWRRVVGPCAASRGRRCLASAPAHQARATRSAKQLMRTTEAVVAGQPPARLGDYPAYAAIRCGSISSKTLTVRSMLPSAS